LSNIVASRVLADFIDGHRMAAAVYLKSHFPADQDRQRWLSLYAHGSVGPPMAPV
jgi:hypothetical protein